MTARLLIGDCLGLMREMPSDSFDAIVTDAPYGMSDPPDIAEVLRHWLPEDPRIVSAIVDLLRIRAAARAGGFWPAIAKHTNAALLKLIAVVKQSREAYKHGKPGFMGSTWDSMTPGPRVWAEALRVAKPGAHALVFASTRTVDLMGIACRLAGWEVRDTLHWLHYQGQPHGLDVSKAIDGLGGDIAPDAVITDAIRKARAAAGMSLRQVGEAVIAATEGEFGAWYHRGGHMFYETGKSVPRSFVEWSALCSVLPIDRSVADMHATAIREVVGQGYRLSMADGPTPNGGVSLGAYDLTTAATEDAAKWEGWNTALKPAIEPILLLRKPLAESSIARQVLATGTGAINIDGCRIPQGSKIWPGPQDEPAQTHSRNVDSPIFGDYGTQTTHTTEGQKLGRYPGNLLHFRKPSRKEKEAGCEGLPMHYSTKGAAAGERGGVLRRCPEHGEPIPSSSSVYGCGCPKVFDKSIPHNLKGRRNHHPTVKPIALMRYLCRLVTPPGGHVCDLFMGSGTTGIGASLGGFDFTGCELDPAFVDISRARIKHAVPAQKVEGGTDPEPTGQQTTLFG